MWTRPLYTYLQWLVVTLARLVLMFHSHSNNQVSDSQYTMGHLVLNGVDFRCHGLTEFLYQERVEYAWLMQLCVGRIAGAFSTQQVRLLTSMPDAESAVTTFVFHVVNVYIGLLVI